jgi:hypothetical protein
MRRKNSINWKHRERERNERDREREKGGKRRAAFI